MRESLEGRTARRAAERAGEAELRRLKRHLDKASRAAAAGRLEEFGDANVTALRILFGDPPTAIGGTHSRIAER
ncbi:FCD domain-containing protein [Nonomuraea sp. B19D2]|uniref:FCD domain-containing protein n=1 Tax=Nonomuraea sp. B19D2 TaxID=3159561 RepID=UPI0032DB957D